MQTLWQNPAWYRAVTLKVRAVALPADGRATTPLAEQWLQLRRGQVANLRYIFAGDCRMAEDDDN